MLIDTHCHLNSPHFCQDYQDVTQEARRLGLTDAVICAGSPDDFARTQSIAHTLGFHYALGIHPLCVNAIDNIDQTLSDMRQTVEQAMDDPLFVAIGEIGLDFFDPTIDQVKARTLFLGQCRMAHAFSLPVSLHSRHAVDSVLAGVRQTKLSRGVFHAFNGSSAQLMQIVKMGFCVGFGGAFLYSGSRRIRRLLTEVPETNFVLETDAPDMPDPLRRDSQDRRTHPADIVRYVSAAADLRNTTREMIMEQTTLNALSAFPRLQR